LRAARDEEAFPLQWRNEWDKKRRTNGDKGSGRWRFGSFKREREGSEQYRGGNRREGEKRKEAMRRDNESWQSVRGVKRNTTKRCETKWSNKMRREMKRI
jgi:hypothetical protein